MNELGVFSGNDNNFRLEIFCRNVQRDVQTYGIPAKFTQEYYRKDHYISCN